MQKFDRYTSTVITWEPWAYWAGGIKVYLR